jgi:hypothetical protein
MATARTPEQEQELAQERQLDHRYNHAMQSLRLLTRMADATAGAATPSEEAFEQWELMHLFEMQTALLDELEAVEAGRIEIWNARYRREHPEPSSGETVQ